MKNQSPITNHYIIYLRDLTLALTIKELKSKYTSTTLGFLWVFLNPLLQMIVLSIVFSLFIKIPVENYPLFAFSGLLPWTFFTLSLQAGTASLIGNRDLLKKVNFPREILPISSVLAHLFTFLLAMLLLLCFVILTNHATIYLLLLILIIFLQTLLSISLVLLLSSFDIYYRDVSFILQAIIPLWFYLTPIFYPISLIPKQYLFFYQLNPMVGIITAYQTILANTQPFLLNSIFTTSIETFILFCISIVIFKKRSKYFADWI